jgi:ABC-type phosphate/phosphonate transport system ATPase subunit
MTTHYLDNWKQYLTNDDYDYLIQYIENIKNNIPNHKMIILSGPSGTGKSTLQTDIIAYLGKENCGDYYMSCDFIYDENIKPLGFFCGIDGISKSKKSNRAIINYIKYKQSFIASTIHIEKVNNKLLEYSKIIMMTHIL